MTHYRKNLSDLNPEEVDALFSCARSQIDEEHLSAAEIILLLFAEELPDYDHGMVWYELADIFERTSRFNFAEDAYRRALSCEPESDIYLLGLAMFLWRHDKREEARAAFEQTGEVYQRRNDTRRLNAVDRVLDIFDRGQTYLDYERQHEWKDFFKPETDSEI